MSPTVIHLSSDSSLDESTSACGFSVSSKGTLVLFCVSGFPLGSPVPVGGPLHVEKQGMVKGSFLRSCNHKNYFFQTMF